MRTVKSEADLYRLAARTGASIDTGSSVINSSGARARQTEIAPVAPPTPQPTLPPAAPAVIPPPQVTIDMTPIAESHLHVGNMLAQAMSELANRRVPYVFDVEYEGLKISRITATPI